MPKTSPFNIFFKKATEEANGSSHQSADGNNAATARESGDCDPLAELYKELRDYAYGMAKAGGETSPDKNRMSAIETYAIGRAVALRRVGFDTAEFPHDRLLQSQLDVIHEKRQRLTANEEVADALRRKLALTLPADEPPPQISGLLVACAVGVFALAFGSSLEPILAEIDDAGLRWFFALGLGAAIGSLIVLTLFGIQLYGRNNKK